MDQEIQEEIVTPTALKNPLFIRLSRGGLRGVQVLSLAECRNLSDAGVMKLN